MSTMQKPHLRGPTPTRTILSTLWTSHTNHRHLKIKPFLSVISFYEERKGEMRKKGIDEQILNLLNIKLLKMYIFTLSSHLN